MTNGTIRILVVEDHTLVREGLVAMLDGQEDIDVVGEAEDGKEALRLADELRPDVLLLDLRIPEIDGLEVLKRVKADQPGIRVLVLTVHDEQAYVAEAVVSGADGYLLKTVNHAELADAIRRLMAGEAVLHPSVARTVIKEMSNLAAGDGPSTDLSVRELEVMKLLAQGLSNKQIAVRLGLGVETIKSHISSILAKLGAVDRTQAVALAMRRGLIE
jgi:DNA-binding NarL/FixJ family response regulator